MLYFPEIFCLNRKQWDNELMKIFFFKCATAPRKKKIHNLRIEFLMAVNMPSGLWSCVALLVLSTFWRNAGNHLQNYTATQFSIQYAVISYMQMTGTPMQKLSDPNASQGVGDSEYRMANPNWMSRELCTCFITWTTKAVTCFESCCRFVHS
jgi:hypothetical protein